MKKNNYLKKGCLKLQSHIGKTFLKKTMKSSAKIKVNKLK